MQIVDEVIPEPLGGAHRDHRAMAATLKQSLQRAVQRLSLIPIPKLLERRYQKFRRMGVYEELAVMDDTDGDPKPPQNGSGGGPAGGSSGG